jgi:hypothetical protein
MRIRKRDLVLPRLLRSSPRAEERFDKRIDDGDTARQ